MIPIFFTSGRVSYISSVLAIIFGAIALFFPSLTLAGIGIVFAVALLIGGISMIIASQQQKKHGGEWGLTLGLGILTTVLGIVVLAAPEGAVGLLVTLMGIWALIIGVWILFGILRSDRNDTFRYIMLTVGIISVILGIVLILNPFETSRVLIIIIGLYSLIYGIASLFRKRKRSE